MEVPLAASNLCRLCAADNSSGSPIFVEEDGVNLSELINSYLPLKVADDGHYSRTICPGCAIQLEATVEFFNLIIKGQSLLREVLLQEKKNEPKEIIINLTIENGLYPEDHALSLQAVGLDKPKRKRGRPKKVAKPKDEVVQVQIAEVRPPKVEVVLSGKRKRKTPERFREAVQGKELERIFKEEGVIDENESDGESNTNEPSPSAPATESTLDEVIGHMQTADGTPAGEPIKMTKGKGRGRPKGPTRSNKQQCAICGEEFSCLGRYMAHVAQHGRVMYQCEQCRSTFHNRLLFNEHQGLEEHKGLNVIKCEDEGQENKVEKINESTYKIEDEEETSQENTESATAQERQAKEVPPNDTQEICVKFIDTQNATKSEYGVQESTESPVEEPLNQVAEFQQLADPEIQCKEPVSKEDPLENKLKCPQCDKVFSSKQSKSMHIKAYHAGLKPYACMECNMRFPYPRSLAMHMATHRKQQHHGYACDLCGKVLNHPSSVVYHKEAEHTGKRFKCIKCGKLFKHKQLLQRHQLVHTQVRPYICKLCNASFKTKANLLNHQQLHSGIKKYSCEICNQPFAHKTSLTLHMRWHSGQKPYECKECGKKFTQRGNLQEHQRTHTGEKPYQCALCPKTFTTSSQLRLHNRRHTGEKPFVCTHCGKRFVTSEAWRAHVRRELGQLEHWCSVCGRGFAERWALMKHQRCHTGEKPFPCPHCPRAFADCSNLTKHKKIHKAANSLLVKNKKAQKSAAAVSEEEEEAGEEKVIYVTYNVDGDNDSPTFHILDAEQATELDGSKVLTTTCDLYDGSSLLVNDDQIELSAEMEGVEGGDMHNAILGDLEPMEARIYIEDQKMEGDLMMEQQHMSVTDEDGNPIHFTMQDGTTIEITSSDGKSLQVLTQDGQSIPVELNGYKEVREMESEMGVECVEVDEVEAEEVVGEGEEEQVRMLTLDDSTLSQFFTIE